MVDNFLNSYADFLDTNGVNPLFLMFILFVLLIIINTMDNVINKKYNTWSGPTSDFIKENENYSQAGIKSEINNLCMRYKKSKNATILLSADIIDFVLTWLIYFFITCTLYCYVIK